MHPAVPRLTPEVLDDLDRRLAPADAELPAQWGARALAALTEHAAGAAALAAATGVDQALVEQVHPGVLAKLEREPIEDLRLDFEDGYGPRPHEAEDADALGAARALAGALARAAPPPYVGLRIRCLEAATRRRGLRTLDLFVGGLLAETGLP